jgi:L-histidine N-alpha-methyltransferase
MLNVINRVAETDFDPQQFDHLAFYNAKEKRIEMHLKATRDMVISSPEFPGKVVLKKGETIHTENSHKFTIEDINRFGTLTGLSIENIFSDEKQWFSLVAFKYDS